MTMVGAVIAAIAAAAALGWVRRRYVVAVVDGQSMAPTFGPNDQVLVWRTRRPLRPGQVVVLERPTWGGEWRTEPLGVRVHDRSWLIKRVAAVAGQPMPGEAGTVPAGHVAVLGDNAAASVDSRHWGPIPRDRVLGVAIRRLSPP